MKKILCIVTLALCNFCMTYACKAMSFPIVVTQSNGQQITVYLHGDVDFSWYTDEQGNILLRNGNDFTPITVSKEEFFRKAEGISKVNQRRREPIANSAALFPHTGSPKALVILAQFSDVKFTLPNPKKSFDQYLNKLGVKTHENYGNGEQRNYGSVKQYFIDQSGGAFSPQFDIYGPVTVPQTMAYYGKDASENSRDTNVRQLIADACAAIEDSIDFADYDADGNDTIDLVYVIYAGYGQSTGGANETIWPKRFNAGLSTTYDGMKVDLCGVSNELLTNTQINGIGLFCHEFSHCLGLPDFYATKGNAIGMSNQGIEDWSVMDNGLYNGYGYVPVSYTAWEREAFGWSDPIEELTDSGQVKLTDISNGGKAFKIVNPNDSKEYFVVQAFLDKGWNQRMAYYSDSVTTYNPETRGLLVYHVNYNYSFSISSNTVNNTVGKPRMVVVPADGNLESSYNKGKTITVLNYAKEVNGDLFRGDSTFTQSSGLPNAAWWTTTDDTPIYNINYVDDAVYIDFLKKIASTATAIGGITINKETSDKIYTIDGRYVGTSTSVLPKGLYIRNGKKFVVR